MPGVKGGMAAKIDLSKLEYVLDNGSQRHRDSRKGVIREQVAWDCTAERIGQKTVVYQDGTPIIVYPYSIPLQARFSMFGWNTMKTRQRINSFLPRGWVIHKEGGRLFLDYTFEPHIMRTRMDEYGLWFVSAAEDGDEPNFKLLASATSHEAMIHIF